MDLCLRGGRVIDPGRGVDAEADVILKDGVVARSGKGIAAGLSGDVRIIDVRGKWVIPGLIDLHTHLREPGHEYKEDIATGTRAAARRSKPRFARGLVLLPRLERGGGLSGGRDHRRLRVVSSHVLERAEGRRIADPGQRGLVPPARSAGTAAEIPYRRELTRPARADVSAGLSAALDREVLCDPDCPPSSLC